MSSDTGGHCPQGVWSWGTKRGEGPSLSRMALAPAGFQPDAAEWSGATGGNGSAVLGASPGKTMNKRAVGFSHCGAGRERGWWGRPRLIAPAAATAFDAGRPGRALALSGGAGRSPGFLAGKRVSVQFSRTHWQTNEFRSSRNTPRAPPWLLSGGLWGLKRDVPHKLCCFYNRIPSHAGPDGFPFQESLLRNSFCCHWGPRDYSETRFVASATLESQ